MKVWLAILMLLTPPALAAGPARPGEGAPSAANFPQPVRVGGLIGQKLIAPRESQPLLGTIEAVERSSAGALAIRVKTSSLLPWGGRVVTVPLDAVAFLGPQLALTGLTEAKLDALPTAASQTSVAPDEIIRIGLVKPFH